MMQHIFSGVDTRVDELFNLEEQVVGACLGLDPSDAGFLCRYIG